MRTAGGANLGLWIGIGVAAFAGLIGFIGLVVTIVVLTQ